MKLGLSDVSLRRIAQAVAQEAENPDVIEDPNTDLMLAKEVGQDLMWTQVESFVAGLNQAMTGGFSDWRIPTIEELNSLYQAGSLASLGENFLGISDRFFWSSTPDTDPENPNLVQGLQSWDGGVMALDKDSDAGSLVCVRGTW